MLEKLRSLATALIRRAIHKVYFAVQLALVRTAADVHNLAQQLLAYEIRKLDSKFSIPGDFENDDKVILVVAAQLLDIPVDGELSAFAAENESRVQQVQQLAAGSPEVKMAVAKVHLAKNFFYTTSYQADKASASLQKAQALLPGAVPYDAAALAREKPAIRKRLRELHSELEDRYGFKLDINLSDIGGLIALWSVLFVISGYLYTSSLLHALGIHASAFLSITDYLSASVDQIRYAGLATGWAVLVYLVGTFDGSRKSNLQVRKERPARERTRSLIWILIVVLVLVCAWTYINERKAFYGFAKFLGILLSMAVADAIAYKAFVKPIPAVAILTAVFTFAVHLATSVGEEIYKLENDAWKPSMKAELSIRDPDDPTLRHAGVLAGAGNFLILFDETKKRIVVLPRERIQHVEISR